MGRVKVIYLEIFVSGATRRLDLDKLTDARVSLYVQSRL